MAEPINYSLEVSQLFQNQMKDWSFMANNYKDLDKIRIKKLEFPNFYMNVQFNPARIKSSAAKVDKQSIENRSCFLCTENRPKEQQAIEFEDNLLIMINPYPIFKNHLTITHKEHVPQLIKGNFKSMLKLAEALPEFTIFYNGPRSGASAPDHFHFQAGSKNDMPIDSQLEDLKNHYSLLIKDGICKVWKINDDIRKFILIQSSEADKIENKFDEIYTKLLLLKSTADEPDLNILCSFDKNEWNVMIFPRGGHRPRQFYAGGEENIVFSPASVDLGGLIIIPLEKDFGKINKPVIEDMMRQIALNDMLFSELKL